MEIQNFERHLEYELQEISQGRTTECHSAVDTAPLPKDRIKVLKLLTVYSQGKQAVTR